METQLTKLNYAELEEDARDAFEAVRPHPASPADAFCLGFLAGHRHLHLQRWLYAIFGEIGWHDAIWRDPSIEAPTDGVILVEERPHTYSTREVIGDTFYDDDGEPTGKVSDLNKRWQPLLDRDGNRVPGLPAATPALSDGDLAALGIDE